MTLAPGRIVLEGVDRYRVMEPLFEGVRVILTHRGEAYSPAYVQGLSGAAFRVGGICPCAPTCANAMSTQDLITLLGYEFEHLSLWGEGVSPHAKVEDVVARVKAELRGGHPALVWHAFTMAEWDVVAGYDDEQGLFLGRGSYLGCDGYATADQRRMATAGDIAPPFGAILIGERVWEPDLRAAERAVLEEAVRHARSTTNLDKLGGEKWVMLDGLACYDRWIRDFASDPPRLANMGDRYCCGVYRSTHAAAADFLRELAASYPAAALPLECAAVRFAQDARALHEAATFLFPGWQLPQTATRESNDTAGTLLQEARDAYAAGIAEIEAALRLL